jgi:glutamate-1-semialdehyde aminotransferase
VFSQTREHIVVGVAVMEHVAADGYEIVGTFNGNPLAMAAARHAL